MIKKLKTLIVDDEPELRKSIISVIKSAMPEWLIEADEAGNGLDALAKVQNQSWDLVLLDVRMPEMSGLEALSAIKEQDPRTFVVIITAHANLQDAVTSIRKGAYDYIEKPIQPERLVEIVKKAIEAREMVTNLAIANPIFDDDIDSEFVGSSQKMKKVFDLIYRLAKVDTTVLIRGENGTGKELVARAIHFNSPRKEGAFVAINCGAIPENLVESEFFGHEKGAFTGAIQRQIGKFQLANKGTIFLDEIGELKPDIQVKLLRVLQEKSFLPVGSNRELKTSARIITATNKNLEKMIEDSTFREDLFYRLNVMPIFLPPLKERLDDLDSLVDHFIKKFERQHRRNITAIESEALNALKAYNWPGNIRELENVIEHAFIVENAGVLTLQSLPENVQKAAKQAPRVQVGTHYEGPLNYEVFKEQIEKEFIINALKANKGRINQTVAHVNIPKNTLLRKIKKYGIQVKDYTEE